MELTTLILNNPIVISFIIMIAVGWIINLFGIDQEEDIVGFKFKKMPVMQPIKIPTQGCGFWKSVYIWLFKSRQWVIAEDWYFSIGDTKYIIPKGFEFDGASVPKFLRAWLSPIGILLLGGLVHDYIYKYAHLDVVDHNDIVPSKLFTQKQADQLFRDINIEQNGIHFLNYAAYYALRAAGFVAWNSHRKVS